MIYQNLVPLSQCRRVSAVVVDAGACFKLGTEFVDSGMLKILTINKD